MKSIISVLIAVTFAGLAKAQLVAPTEYVNRVAVNLAYAAPSSPNPGTPNGASLAVRFAVNVTQTTATGATITTAAPSIPALLAIDLIAKADTALPNGHTYGEVLADIQAIIAQERAAQLAARVSAKP